MKLKRLEIIRMPGFERQGLLLDNLSPGLNIIYGPNASGKTTSCKAIRGLLWPEELQDVAYPELQSIWQQNGNEIQITRQGDGANYPNQDFLSKHVPGQHLAKCFTITIDDIVTGTNSEHSSLAERIAREARGGFDIRASSSHPNLVHLPKRTKTLHRQLMEARRKLRRINSEQKELFREKSEIARLQQQLEGIERREREGEYLTLASEILLLSESKSVLAAELENFPAVLSQMEGTEAELHKILTEQLQALTRELAHSKEDLQTAHSEEIPPEIAGLSDEAFSLISYSSKELRELQERISENKEALSRLIAEGQDDSLDSLYNSLSQTDKNIYDLLNVFEETGKRRDSLREKIDLLSNEVQHQKNTSKDALWHRLHSLLESHTSTLSANREHRLRILIWSLIAILSVVLGLAGILHHPAYWLLLTIPAVVTAITFRTRHKPNGLPTSQAAEDILGQFIHGVLDAARYDDSQKTNAQKETRLQELNHQCSVLDSELANLLPGLEHYSGSALSGLIKRLAELHRVRCAATALQTLLAEQEEKLEGLCKECSTFYSNHGFDTADDPNQIQARFEFISSRRAIYLQQQKVSAVSKSAIKRIQIRLEEIQQRLAALYSSLGLSSDNDAELAVLLQRWPEFSTLKDQFSHKATELQQKRRLLEQSEYPSFLQLDAAEIDKLSSELQIELASRKVIAERLGVIRGKLEQARTEGRLEEALAEETRARLNLEADLDTAQRAASASFLLNIVEEQYELDIQPRVFREAARLFEQFTRGRYTLLPISKEVLQFQVRELTGTALTLDQLSRGTAMQLLLAVRISFALCNEQGEQLPIVLDEALSSSDPERFCAICEAMATLVQAGRQVFYFSCRKEDTAAWRAAALGLNDEQIRLIDLSSAAQVDSETTVDKPLVAAVAEHTQSLPSPEGKTLREYLSLLNIAPLNPLTGARNTHIAHLLTDSHLLHNLLSLGIDTYGQLIKLWSEDALSVVIPDKQFEEIRARAALVDAFASASKIGRGKPLTPEIIRAASKSEVFGPRLIAQAREHRWNTKPFLESIDPQRGKSLKRFQQTAYEDIRNDLLEKGYFDPQEPLDRESSRSLVLRDIAPYLKNSAISVQEVGAMFEELWNCIATE